MQHIKREPTNQPTQEGTFLPPALQRTTQRQTWNAPNETTSGSARSVSFDMFRPRSSEANKPSYISSSYAPPPAPAATFSSGPTQLPRPSSSGNIYLPSSADHHVGHVRHTGDMRPLYQEPRLSTHGMLVESEQTPIANPLQFGFSKYSTTGEVEPRDSRYDWYQAPAPQPQRTGGLASYSQQPWYPTSVQDRDTLHPVLGRTEFHGGSQTMASGVGDLHQPHTQNIAQNYAPAYGRSRSVGFPPVTWRGPPVRKEDIENLINSCASAATKHARANEANPANPANPSAIRTRPTVTAETTITADKNTKANSPAPAGPHGSSKTKEVQAKPISHKRMTDTQILSMECQLRGFNYKWLKAPVDGVNTVVAIDLDGTVVNCRKKNWEAAEPTQSLARRALAILKATWPNPTKEKPKTANCKQNNAVSASTAATAGKSRPTKSKPTKSTVVTRGMAAAEMGKEAGKEKQKQASSDFLARLCPDANQIMGQIERLVGAQVPEETKADSLAAKSFLSGFAMASRMISLAQSENSRDGKQEAPQMQGTAKKSESNGETAPGMPRKREIAPTATPKAEIVPRKMPKAETVPKTKLKDNRGKNQPVEPKKKFSETPTRPLREQSHSSRARSLSPMRQPAHQTLPTVCRYRDRSPVRSYKDWDRPTEKENQRQPVDYDNVKTTAGSEDAAPFSFSFPRPKK